MTDIKQKAREVKAMHITDVVADPEWQEVRKSLIGHWVNNHERNVDILRNYFHKYHDEPIAVRRLVNVLTGSVHRSGKTADQPKTDELRKDVRVRWREMLDEPVDHSDPRYSKGVI